jgi:hypothetical protein
MLPARTKAAIAKELMALLDAVVDDISWGNIAVPH